MQISRPLWASKPECDAHICLNLGFTSQNFRLTQVSPHVCYFWSSPFRMDEGNTLLGEQGFSQSVYIAGSKLRPSLNLCGPSHGY